MTKELTLIDLSSIFWQTYAALEHKPHKNSYDATCAKVYRHINNDNPVAICIDSPPYKRKDIDPNYKANREQRPPAIYKILEDVIERLDKDGFPVLGSDGYEADDIIATIVLKMHEKDTETPPMSIISSDKDLLQLLCPELITQTSPLTGEVFGANEVVEKFGVMPAKMGDYLALKGDNSDNIPGVKGIGPKTAATLLKTHGWENLIHLIDIGDPDNEINPPGVRQKLIDGYDDLLKSRELVELMTDAPIDVETIFKPRVPRQEEPKKESEPMDETKPEPELDHETTPLPARSKTAIVKAESWNLALEPQNSGSAWKLAQLLSESGLYTKFSNAQSILAVMLRGRALGIDSTTALDGFHVIMGKLSMTAQLIIALVLKSGKADYFKCIETTSEKATWKTHRRDDPDPDPTILSWDIDKANNWIDSKTKKPLSSQDNWQHDPAGMLRWRSGCDLGRLVYPDVIAGLYTPDELSDDQYVEAEVVQ